MYLENSKLEIVTASLPTFPLVTLSNINRQPLSLITDHWSLVRSGHATDIEQTDNVAFDNNLIMSQSLHCTMYMLQTALTIIFDKNAKPLV